jgi:hypothetical protein
VRIFRRLFCVLGNMTLPGLTDVGCCRTDHQAISRFHGRWVCSPEALAVWPRLDWPLRP